MKLDKKELIYECRYKNMRWNCMIKDIEHTKQITGFTVSDARIKTGLVKWKN